MATACMLSPTLPLASAWLLELFCSHQGCCQDSGQQLAPQQSRLGVSACCPGRIARNSICHPASAQVEIKQETCGSGGCSCRGRCQQRVGYFLHLIRQPAPVALLLYPQAHPVLIGTRQMTIAMGRTCKSRCAPFTRALATMLLTVVYLRTCFPATVPVLWTSASLSLVTQSLISSQVPLTLTTPRWPAAHLASWLHWADQCQR